MQVRELMSGALIAVRPGTSMVAARRLMAERGTRHLLVTSESGELMGIVTDRDMRLNAPSPATSLSVWEINYLLAELTVDAIMTRSVITVGPDREARAAAELMLEHKIGALPVLNGGRLVGIVTETDIVRAFVRMRATASALRH